MALYKFRKGGDDNVSAAAPLESVDAMRRRAVHRLIGAVVLVVAGVIGFPMLFDNQPRPIAVDIPIEIPDKAKSRPLVLPVEAAKPTPNAAPAIAAAATPATSPAVTAPSVTAPLVVPKEPVADPKPVEKAVEKAATPPAKTPEPAKPAVAAPPKPAPPPVAANSAAESAKAQALLEGKPAASADSGAPATEGRFVVQVGAFADAAKAKEARSKLERAGLKTYTQVVETKDGPRTRVRVGPFGDKAQAESSAAKIKALDLPASILVL